MQPSPMAETCKLPLPSLRFCMSFLPRCVVGSWSGAVLFVADLFHPLDHLAVQRFLNGDMGHRRGWRSTMPVLLAGRTQDHVSGPDLLLGLAPTLGPAEAGGHDQRLTERMRMPSRAGARLECHAGSANARRCRCLEQRVDPDCAGEVVRRPLGRWL